MSSITLELLAYQSSTYAAPSSIELDIANHVHKRIERFIYRDDIKPEHVPLTYVENKELDSWVNLQLSNRTYSVSANSPKHTTAKAGYDVIVGGAYGSVYRDIVITNQVFVDSEGGQHPLFWKQNLPTGTVECQLITVSDGNRLIVDEGWTVDLPNEVVYTNYRNYFDPDTGSYRLYFIICTTSEGVAHHLLLNPIPVVKEASWEDIDLDTGKLVESYPVFTTEQITGGWRFYFNTSDKWYIKPIAKSLIQPLLPSGRSPRAPWFLRFTNGNLTALVNDAVRRYWLPEFDSQAFIPHKPFVYSDFNELLIVNRNVVAATRDSLAILPDEGLHLTIFISDVNGDLIRVLTTDQAQSGKRYSNTALFYEVDKIQSWDNVGGFIALGIEVHSSWELTATYYYEADDFEYNLLSLNPINNKSVYNYSFIYYIIPDVGVNDRAIHHMLVNHNGIIVETSQGPGAVTYPNLQLYDEAGNYNSNTVIGLPYISDIESDTFLTRYTAGFDNDNAYMVLAEVNVLDLSIIEDQLEIDVRRDGPSFVESKFKEALSANPKLLQSAIGYSIDGQTVPEDLVMIAEAPLSLLEDYGGVLTKTRAEELLRTAMTSAGHLLVDWQYPKTDLSAQSTTSGEVDLSWTWEGPNQIHRLYRRNIRAAEYTLVTTVSSPAEATLTYTDTDVTSSEVYYYAVTLEEDGVEYPHSNSVSIFVR